MRRYFIWFRSEDSVIVNIKDDVNRPKNEDCDTVLQNWVAENYGDEEYEYFEIDSIPVIEL